MRVIRSQSRQPKIQPLGGRAQPSAGLVAGKGGVELPPPPERKSRRRRVTDLHDVERNASDVATVY